MATNFEIEVFYDGGCPLCRREIDMLRRWDRQNRIRFTDIEAEAFDPAAVGKTMDELMAEIHGRLPDGSLVTGVEVFRRLYSAVGFRKLSALTRLPGISCALNFGYRIFAKNRLKLTGRCKTGVCQVNHEEETLAAAGSGRP